MRNIMFLLHVVGGAGRECGGASHAPPAVVCAHNYLCQISAQKMQGENALTTVLLLPAVASVMSSCKEYRHGATTAGVTGNASAPDGG
jgi:hypothetical protein